MNGIRRILCAALALIFVLNVSVLSVSANVQQELLEDSIFVEETQNPEMPQFFQTDYPDTRFGAGTISSSGCSITSLAMVASYMTGHTYSPEELAGYFGGHGENNMQRLEYGSDMLQLPWRKAENVHEVFAAVKEGSIAILLMNSDSLFTSSQHFIVVKGMTEDGKYLVNDPYEPNYELWHLREGFKTGFRDGELICGYSGGWIYDVNTMPDEPFIYEEKKPEGPSRYPDIQLTPEEYELLAEVIWVEARGECLEGQQAVAEVILNRVASDDFSDTVSGVVYAEGQFRSVEFLDDAEPGQAQYDAIDDALAGPNILPEDVVFFATYPVNDRVWGEIGGHVFCYQFEE